MRQHFRNRKSESNKQRSVKAMYEPGDNGNSGWGSQAVDDKQPGAHNHQQATSNMANKKAVHSLINPTDYFDSQVRIGSTYPGTALVMRWRHSIRLILNRLLYVLSLLHFHCTAPLLLYNSSSTMDRPLRIGFIHPDLGIGKVGSFALC